ncbi:MAG: tetratricopeptide repeat protein [Chloroflexota bacterium]
MNLNSEDKARIRRDKAKDAITLALGSRWEEAVALNREIVGEFPRDVEAYNRLGKALFELGQYREAKDAFHQALEISPANGIARKNLQRLTHLNEEAAVPKQGSKVTPQLFIEERGKTATASLKKLPPSGGHLRMAPGDAVEFRISGDGLMVESPEGQYLGEIDPKLGQRLVRLIQGGNRYTAAITSVQEQSLVIMIKETYQHRSQYGTASFPNRQSAGGIYSHLGAPPLPIDMDLEEEEMDLEQPPIIDWDEEGEAIIAAPPSDDDERISFSRDDIEEQASF